MNLPFQRGTARQRYLPRTQVAAQTPVILRLRRHRHVQPLSRPRIRAAAGDMRGADGVPPVKKSDGAVGKSKVAEIRVFDGHFAVKFDGERRRGRR